MTTGGRGRQLLTWLAAAVLGLGVAACGGSGSPRTEDGRADPNGELRIAYQFNAPGRGYPLTLNPMESVDAFGDIPVHHLIYGGLMRFTPDGGMTPDLAESVTVVDAETVEIVLREGLKFPDGSALDAAAVKTALEAYLATPELPSMIPAFYSLEEVEVVNETTLRLSIPDGTAASWVELGLRGAAGVIVPPGTDFEHPAGAGPFRVVSFSVTEGMVLEKNPDYWDADSIGIAGIEFVNVPDIPAAVGALSAGQVDWIPLDYPNLAAVNSSYETTVVPDPNQLASFTTCKRDEPFSDPLVRRALSMAIDRDAINDAVYGGTSIPAAGIWPEGHPFHNPDLDDVYPYDPDGAQELLAEAGLPDGFTFDIVPAPGQGLPEAAQVIQQQLAQIGVTMNIVQTSNFIEDAYMNPRAPVSLTPVSSQAGLRRLEQWSGPSIGNVCGYEDAELDAMVAELQTITSDDPRAAELWHQVEEYVVDEALSVFVLYRSAFHAYDPERVGNVVSMVGPHTSIPDVREITVEGST